MRRPPTRIRRFQPRRERITKLTGQRKAGEPLILPRRYEWKMHLKRHHAEIAHQWRFMCVDLHNGVLEGMEEIMRRRDQRRAWHDEEAWPVVWDAERRVFRWQGLVWDTERRRAVEGVLSWDLKHGVFTDIDGTEYENDWQHSSPIKSGEVVAHRFFRGQRHAGISRHRDPDALPRFPTAYDLGHLITELRHECPEWCGLPFISAYTVAVRVLLALQAFFRRVKAGERSPGYPRYHGKRNANSIPLGVLENREWGRPHKDDPYKTKTGWSILQRIFQPNRWDFHCAGLTDVRDRGDRIQVTNELPATPTLWRNADIVWRDNRWWLSIAVELDCSREKGREPLTVRFDLFDEFATVNGIPDRPPDLDRVATIGRVIDELKSDRDKRFPRGKRRTDAEKEELRRANRAIGRLYNKARRISRNALHMWTYGLVARASSLTIVAPSLPDLVRTPRGNEQSWGAHVETVSGLNRDTLGQSPGAAIAMLRYKAEEAQIPLDAQKTTEHILRVGPDLVQIGRLARRAKRRAKAAE